MLGRGELSPGAVTAAFLGSASVGSVVPGHHWEEAGYQFGRELGSRLGPPAGMPVLSGVGVSHPGLPPLLSPGKCPKPLKNRDVITLRSWLPMGTDYIIMNYSVKHPVSPWGAWGGQPGVLPAPGRGWVCPMVGGRSGWRHWGAVGGVRGALPAVGACLYPILPLPSMRPCPPPHPHCPPCRITPLGRTWCERSPSRRAT